MKRRYGIVVHGTVQGVGFRPFVYRLAHSLGVAGWVANAGDSVRIEVEGDRARLETFLEKLDAERPPHAKIELLEHSEGEPRGYPSFEILKSSPGGSTHAFMTPDIAVCPECLAELLDPSNRRYRYPFTNCTNCGPRFSIIEKLPYDRPNTTMKEFRMCPACTAEYGDPRDRRFHAQPNACPVCGPVLELWSASGAKLAKGEDALEGALAAVTAGKILALKGLGGFQLLVDAGSGAAVDRLRLRKQREEKPFAIMVPSLDVVRELCNISPEEESLLTSPEAPIVLLKRAAMRTGRAGVVEAVAPRNPYLGIMLPYTPLHHLFMRGIDRAVVATSGNRSDEPICTDEHEALQRLGGIADLFLVHNRPIRRHVDDSVARVVCGRPYVLRRARGYAPSPVFVGSGDRILAVGAHLKNSIAVVSNGYAFMSQHIGDLETTESYNAFERAIDDLTAQHGIEAKSVVADLHPDYLSTGYAVRSGLPVDQIQHHYAHVTSCMVDNRLIGPVLGVSWDGTGYGTDGTIWGGEFIVATEEGWRRAAAFRTFRLPGGDLAVREPRRTALGALYEMYGEAAFGMDDLPPVAAWTTADLRVLEKMLESGLNSPHTSSVGRLFDAVASLCGIRQKSSFEGQAAMELEFAAAGHDSAQPYAYQIQEPCQNGCRVIDWRPMVKEIIHDLRQGTDRHAVSAGFHATLVDIAAQIARMIGEPKIVLTGGCFQNMRLLSGCIARLRTEGFVPYWHHDVPPNDGGIALGQIVAVLRNRGTYELSRGGSRYATNGNE